MTPSNVTAQLPPNMDIQPHGSPRAVTLEGVTRGRDINLYGVYTLHELAKIVPYRYTWLLEMSKVKDKTVRLPTLKRGSQQTIIYADFLDWMRKLYGLDGTCRGQEILELGRRK